MSHLKFLHLPATKSKADSAVAMRPCFSASLVHSSTQASPTHRSAQQRWGFGLHPCMVHMGGVQLV